MQYGQISLQIHRLINFPSGIILRLFPAFILFSFNFAFVYNNIIRLTKIVLFAKSGE
jgi:hypothetical protein